MSALVVPARRVAGLEALELASLLGLDLWCVTGAAGGPDVAMNAGQAWNVIRSGARTAGDFYTFEPAP